MVGGWMDRWMDRWMDGWMDGWMDRWAEFPCLRDFFSYQGRYPATLWEFTTSKKHLWANGFMGKEENGPLGDIKCKVCMICFLYFSSGVTYHLIITSWAILRAPNQLKVPNNWEKNLTKSGYLNSIFGCSRAPRLALGVIDGWCITLWGWWGKKAERLKF